MHAPLRILDRSREFLLKRSMAVPFCLMALLTLSGCFLENIDANKEYAYVLKKGPPLKITQWTLSQRDEKKIGDGLSALQDIFIGNLTEVLHGEPDSERHLREADDAMNGIVEVHGRLMNTAEGLAPTDERFDISIQEADKLVAWIIPYYAAQASHEEQNIASRKYLELYMKLEPAKNSKYHEPWVRSLHNARSKAKSGQVGD